MRSPRIDVPGVPYHIFTRGNNKKAIFRDDRDRLMYLGILKKALRKFSLALYTYALMDNHIHLMLQMAEGFALAGLMHWTQLGYARYFNERYQRVGHVYQSRYHAIPIEKESYFLNVDRYIHLNPVRAGMASRPEDFRWSSYRSRFGLEESIPLNHDAVLCYFGDSVEKQRQEYRDFTESAISKPEEWSHDILQKTTYLGSNEFFQHLKGLK